MNDLFLLKMGGTILAIACIVFGWLTTKKAFRALREENIDGIIRGPVAEHFGLEVLGLGIIVFCFGFGLIYLLIRF